MAWDGMVWDQLRALPPSSSWPDGSEVEVFGSECPCAAGGRQRRFLLAKDVRIIPDPSLSDRTWVSILPWSTWASVVPADRMNLPSSASAHLGRLHLLNQSQSLHAYGFGIRLTSRVITAAPQ